MKQTKSRLVLAEDNSNVVQELRQLLSPEFNLIAAVSNGIALLAAADVHKPDIVVTDVSLPKLSGIDATKRLLKLGHCKAVVIFSENDSPDIVRAALTAGANGYVLKENSEELIAGIRAAMRGKLFLSSGLQQ